MGRFSMKRLTHLRFLISIVSIISGAKPDAVPNAIAEIPLQWTYNLSSTTFERPSTLDPWLNSTTDDNSTVTSVLRDAAGANFVAYDEEFYTIFGRDPHLEILVESSEIFAHDSAIWVWDRNEVWFTGASDLSSVHISILDLESGHYRSANTSPPVVNPGAGCYFEGRVYCISLGNETFQTSIVSVSPSDLTVRTEVNSYFGLRFSSIEDVTWVRKEDKNFMYFSADNLQAFNKPLFPNGSISHTAPAQLPNAIWMFDPQKQILKPVISRGQVLWPTYVKSNKDATTLYTSDFGNPLVKGNGPGGQSWSNPATWSYTIADDGSLHDPQMFSMSAAAATDGFNVDDAGRLWTAEIDGIWIRDSDGKLLGWINGKPLIGNGNTILGITDFALAGDQLIILADTKIWRVKLAQTVVKPYEWHGCP